MKLWTSTLKAAVTSAAALISSMAFCQFQGIQDFAVSLAPEGGSVAVAGDSSTGQTYSGYVYVLLQVPNGGGPLDSSAAVLAEASGSLAKDDKAGKALLAKAPAGSDMSRLASKLTSPTKTSRKLITGTRYAVVAYNASGTYEWGNVYVNPSYTYAFYMPTAIMVYNSYIYFTGYCNSGLSIVTLGEPASGSASICTVRVNPANPNPSTTYTNYNYYNNLIHGASDPQDTALGIAADSSGNIWVSGSHADGTGDSIYIQAVVSDSTLLSFTYAYLTTYDGTAPYICTNGTSGVAVSGNALVSSVQNVYAGGFSYNSSTHTITNGFNSTFTTGSSTNCYSSGISLGGTDLYVAGYSIYSLSFNDFVMQLNASTGAINTTGAYNTWLTPYVVAADPSNNVYVAGITSNGIQTAAYPSTLTTTSSPSWNVYYKPNKIMRTTGILGIAYNNYHVYVGANNYYNVAIGYHSATGVQEGEISTSPAYSTAFGFNPGNSRVYLTGWTGSTLPTGSTYTWSFH